MTYGQSVYKLKVKLERVAVTHVAPVTRVTREVLIVVHEKYFGLYTGYDTLDLIEVKQIDGFPVYIDRRHNDQKYFMVKKRTDEGFALFLCPLKPYKRREVYGISLMNI